MRANISAFLSKVAFVMILLFIGLLPDAIFFAAAAQANPVKTTQNSQLRTGSVYCVQGTVAVRGWEQDLVRRNPGLRRFNWSPITAAKPSVLVFRQSAHNQRRPAQTVNQYHYTKPTVVSYSEKRAVRKEQKSHDEKAVEALIVSTYSSVSLNQPASYSSVYSALDNQRKVNGRLISSHF
jgi:hypothetical protein